MTEQRAIERCLKHRDPAGFEHLVKQFRREAFLHAVTLLGNAHDAEDACQDCFAKAFRVMPTLPALDRFYPWFYRILRNHCLNLMDRRRTRNKHADRLHVQYEMKGGDLPQKDLMQREEQQDVHRALAALHPEHREILMMKYLDNLRYAEIALRLGIPKGTVMSRLYHARHAFRKQMRNLEALPDKEISHERL